MHEVHLERRLSDHIQRKAHTIDSYRAPCAQRTWPDHGDSTRSNQLAYALEGEDFAYAVDMARHQMAEAAGEAQRLSKLTVAHLQPSRTAQGFFRYIDEKAIA